MSTTFGDFVIKNGWLYFIIITIIIILLLLILLNVCNTRMIYEPLLPV